jgi:hypothetical protein
VKRLALALLTVLLLAGCAGAGPDAAPTQAPAYFTQVAELTDELDAQNTAADGQLHETLADTPDDEVGNVFSQVTEEGAARHEAMIDDLELLTPPDDVADAHADLVATSRAIAAQDRVVAAELAGLTADELGARQTSADYLQAESEVDAACAALQDLADEAGADVDICVGLYA